MTAEQPPGDTVSAPAGPGHAPSGGFEIRVRGRLGPHWAAWFDGLDISTLDDGTSVIEGPVGDQAALHGLLQKLRDLGLPLVSLAPIPSDSNTSTKEN